MISVVVAAYCGEKYIDEQLVSIMNQTKKPDEVLICDDNSSDKTVEIAAQFIEKNNLKNWRIIQNKASLGVRNNFYAGVSASNGEIIFFCDQDDIWHLDKIEKMVDVMNKEDALVVTCKRCLVDEKGNKLRSISNELRYPHTIGNKYINNDLNREFRHLTSSGLCTAFKKSIFEKVKDMVVSSKAVYDLPFGVVAAYYGKCFFLKEVLVDHRVHTNNLSQPIGGVFERSGKYSRQIAARKTKINIMEAFLHSMNGELSSSQKVTINKAISIHKEYVKCLENKNFVGALRLLFKSNPMINWSYGIADLICLLK